jgi:hypothetical protein
MASFQSSNEVCESASRGYNTIDTYDRLEELLTCPEKVSSTVELKNESGKSLDWVFCGSGTGKGKGEYLMLGTRAPPTSCVLNSLWR